jgi:hypothetical protein
MPGAATPQVLLEPVASQAASGDITNPMPDAPPSSPTNSASVQQGFPDITMQPELSGGLPPFGQDMNGMLFLISSHTMYVQCGQTYQYNSTLATKIGGYLAGSILGMADGTGIWLNITNANTSNPDTGGAGWVPMAAYGFANIVGLTGGTVNLPSSNTKYSVIVLNGTLTSNLVVQLPQNVQQWLIVNLTSGAFTTTVNTAHSGSSGVQVLQGGFGAPVAVYSIGDGNIYPAIAPLSVPIDQNPTPLTLAERNNTGQILATYFIQSSALENPTVGAVFVQNSVADGWLRKISLSGFEAQLLLSGLGGQLTNSQVPFSVISQWASALFSSAALTGVPTAPTASVGTNSTQIATTAFVAGLSSLLGNGYYVAPNGWKIQWGLANPPGNLITFGTTSGTVAMTISAICATGIAGGAVQAWVDAGTLTSNAFKVNTTGGNAFWIAIGR